MKILFIAFGDTYHGLGHVIRTTTVMQEARKKHDVMLAGNYKANFKLDNIYDYNQLNNIIDYFTPDWLVIDILDDLPDYIIKTCCAHDISIALLNGVGRVTEESNIYVVWAQDTPDKAIIRSEVRKCIPYRGRETLVWGGAADELGLCNMYTDAMNDYAWLIKTPLAKYPIKNNHKLGQYIIEANDDTFLTYLSQARRVVTHVGMISWECAYLKIPMFMFSRSFGHLQDGIKFDKLGYGKAYPEVGLPSKEGFREFLAQPNEFTGVPPDGLGAARFMEMLT